MRLHRGRLAALLLLTGVVWTCGMAAVIDVSPVERLATPPSQREVLEQRWQVTATTAADVIQELHIDALCQVVVSYAATQASNGHELPLMTVRASGSDFKLISAVQVSRLSVDNTAATPIGGMTIRLQEAKHLNAVDGFVGIQVVVHQPQLVRKLRVSGAGDVIIGDGVVTEGDGAVDLLIESSGSGSIYLPPAFSANASAFEIKATGSGSVYLPEGGDLMASKVTFHLEGTGEIMMKCGSLHTVTDIWVLANGTNDVCVDASHVETNVISVSHDGSGDVFLGLVGTTDAGRYHQRGSGSLDMGSIVCIDVDVQLYGTGNVTVASERSLSGHDYGTGVIMYTGETPVDVLPVDPWAYVKIPIATPVHNYKPRACLVPPTPGRDLTRVTFAASSASSWWLRSRVSLVLVVLLGFSALYAVDKWRARRAKRRRQADERTPFLEGEGAPVYV